MSIELVNIILCYGGSWELVNDRLEYLPFGLPRRALRIPVNISFSKLVKVVAKKAGLDKNNGFRLCYKMSTYTHPVDIVDDEDVSMFIQVVRSNSYGDLTLFVVQQVGIGSGSNQPCIAESPISFNLNMFPTEEINYPSHYQYPYQHTIEENHDDYEDEDYNPLADPEVAKCLGVSDSSDGEGKNDDEEDMEKGIVGVPCAMTPNYLWSMPEPMGCPVFNENLSLKKSYESSSKVIEGQFFKDKKQLQCYLGMKCLEDGYEYKVSQSNSSRFEAKCVYKGCEWFIRATLLKNNQSVFQVRTFRDHHTCPKTQTHPNHRNANKRVLGHIIRDQLKDSSRLYRGNDIITDLNQRFKINVSYSQAWRGKCHAIELLRGSDEESFMNLPIYCHNLKRANPGTVTHIKTDSTGRFEFLFIAIGAAIRSFCNYLRPLLVIDGAHLKGRYLGTMFLAVGMDGNNQILPVAYGVGKTEDAESWTWFLSNIKECIGERPGLAIISDRAASIDLSIRNVFPDAYHGLCCRHLLVNLGLNTHKNKIHQMLYWRMCKSYRVSDFEEWKARLEAACPSVTRTLSAAGYHKWSRAYFPGDRFNIMTSNSAESINSLSRFARKLPIIMLIEFFRSVVQNWYFIRRETGEKLQNDFTRWAECKIEKRMSKSAKWMTHGIDQWRFEVHDGGKKGLVDFSNGTCSCRKWQLSGIPCGHVMAVSRWLNHSDCNQFVSPWYSKHIYQQTYQQCVYPTPDQSEWEIPDDLIRVLPPLMNKRQAGRPRNIDRIPSKGEEKKIKQCSRCHEIGHMRNKCTAPIPSESTWRYKERKSSMKKKSESTEHVDLNESVDDTFGYVDLNEF